MLIHIECMGAFDPHGLILCVSEGFLSGWIWIHNVGMGTVGLHELILCVCQGLLSLLLCIHIVCIETCGLHRLILCVPEDLLSWWMWIHNLCMETELTELTRAEVEQCKNYVICVVRCYSGLPKCKSHPIVFIWSERFDSFQQNENLSSKYYPELYVDTNVQWVRAGWLCAASCAVTCVMRLMVWRDHWGWGQLFQSRVKSRHFCVKRHRTYLDIDLW